MSDPDRDLDLRLDWLGAMALAGVGVFSFACSLFSWASAEAVPRRREFCAYLLWMSAAAATAEVLDELGEFLRVARLGQRQQGVVG